MDNYKKQHENLYTPKKLDLDNSLLTGGSNRKLEKLQQKIKGDHFHTQNQSDDDDQYFPLDEISQDQKNEMSRESALMYFNENMKESQILQQSQNSEPSNQFQKSSLPVNTQQQLNNKSLKLMDLAEDSSEQPQKQYNEVSLHQTYEKLIETNKLIQSLSHRDSFDDISLQQMLLLAMTDKDKFFSEYDIMPGDYHRTESILSDDQEVQTKYNKLSQQNNPIRLFFGQAFYKEFDKANFDENNYGENCNEKQFYNYFRQAAQFQNISFQNQHEIIQNDELHDHYREQSNKFLLNDSKYKNKIFLDFQEDSTTGDLHLSIMVLNSKLKRNKSINNKKTKIQKSMIEQPLQSLSTQLNLNDQLLTKKQYMKKQTSYKNQETDTSNNMNNLVYLTRSLLKYKLDLHTQQFKLLDKFLLDATIIQGKASKQSKQVQNFLNPFSILLKNEETFYFKPFIKKENQFYQADDEIPEDVPLSFMLYKHSIKFDIKEDNYQQNVLQKQNYVCQKQIIPKFAITLPKDYSNINNYQVIFLKNITDGFQVNNKQSEDQFLKNQFVLVTQKSLTQNKQENLIIYSLDNLVIQENINYQFDPIIGGFYNKASEHDDTFILLSERTLYSISSERVQKKEINEWQPYNLHGLQGQNQIKNEELQITNKKGIKQIVQVKYIVGGSNKINDIVIIYPFFDSDEELEQLKSVLSNRQKNGKFFCIQTDQILNLPLLLDNNFGLFLQNMTPKSFLESKIPNYLNMKNGKVIFYKDSRILFINNEEICSWHINDCQRTSLQSIICSPFNQAKETLFSKDIDKIDLNIQVSQLQKLFLQQFHPSNNLLKNYQQTNKNINVNPMYLLQSKNGVMFSHHHLWILQQEQKIQIQPPVFNAPQNFLIMSFDQEQISLIKLFNKEDQKIKIVKYHVAEQLAIFFFEQIIDENSLFFFVIVQISDLQQYELQRQKVENNKEIKPLLQINKTICYCLHKIKKLRVFYYGEKITLDNSKNQPGYLEFEPFCDLNQPKAVRNFLPFLFFPNVKEEKQKFISSYICLLNFESLQTNIHNLPKPTNFQEIQQNWFGEIGFLLPHKINYFTKTFDQNENFDFANQLYLRKKSLISYLRPKLFTRNSKWHLIPFNQNNQTHYIWNATFLVGLVLDGYSYEFREFNIKINSVPNQIYSSDSFLKFTNPKINEQNNLSISIEPIGLKIIGRHKDYYKLHPKSNNQIHLNDILIPELDDSGQIIGSSLIICTNYQSTQSQMSTQANVNSNNQVLLYKIRNEIKKSIQSNNIFEYEIINLESNTMNKFVQKLVIGGYKHIGFTNAYHKQFSVLSVNLTKQVYKAQFLNNHEILILLFKQIKQILTLSEPNFTDYFDNLKEDNFFQPRLALGGINLCTSEICKIESNTHLLQNAVKQKQNNFYKNSILSRFNNPNVWIDSLNLNRFFDLQCGLNFESILQFFIDQNKYSSAIILIDFLFCQQENHELFQLIIKDLPQIISIDNINLSQITLQNRADLEIELSHNELPILGPEEIKMFSLKLNCGFISVQKIIEQIIENSQNDKDDFTRVRYKVIIWELLNLKLKEDVFCERVQSKSTSYLEVFKSIHLVQFDHLFLAGMIAESQQESIYQFPIIRKTIDYQFEMFSQPILIKRTLSYNCLFILPYFITILMRNNIIYIVDYDVLLLCNLIGLFQQIHQFKQEIPEIKYKGFANYFQEFWNIFEFIQIFVFVIHFGITLREIQENYLTLLLVDNIFELFLMVCIIIKLGSQLRFTNSFKLLWVMLIQITKSISSFLIVFFLFDLFFLLMFLILDAKFDDEDGQLYKGLPNILKQVIQVHRNSVGNISPIAFEDYLVEETIINKIQKSLIWLIWFVNIVFMLIVMLNFLIAQVGQVYEDVETKADIYNYQLRANANFDALKYIKYNQGLQPINNFVSIEPIDCYDEDNNDKAKIYQSISSSIDIKFEKINQDVQKYQQINQETLNILRNQFEELDERKSLLQITNKHYNNHLIN